MDHHRWWIASFSLTKEMWGVSEHETGMKMLENAGGYDALDLCNISAIECVLRKVQLVEYVYGQEAPETKKDGKAKGRGKGGTARAGMFDEASVFTGSHREAGDVMLCPELLDYVAKEVERDASVMKQVRKAREERKLAAGDQG